MVHWPRTFRLIWSAAPRWTVAWAILLLLQGIQPVAAVYLIKLLVDSLVKAANAGGDWVHVRPALVLVALMVAVMLLAELLQSLSDLVRTAQSELVQDHIKGLVHEQSALMDLSAHESSEYQDSLDRARSEAGTRPLALLESAGSLVQNGITLLAMAAVLTPFGPWIPLILLLSTLPAFIVVLVFDRRYHSWWQQRTRERRLAQYYDLLVTHSATAAELRLFGLNRHFQAGYQRVRRLLRSERLTQIKRQSLARFVASALAQIVAGLTLAWMMWRVLLGAVTLGDLALFYQAFSRGQGLLRSLLGNVGQIYTNSLFLENLFTFLDMRPQVADPSEPVATPPRLRKGIEFRHVSFSYPGTERPALQDFNLFVPAGKIAAIVGANGAGKTTLLKLLCRFYDPQGGHVELDGIDVRQLSLEQLRKMTTVLFQFPINYQATAAQSIALGDLASTPGPAEIEAAARGASLHELIERLPQGYDTLLGKSFGNGVELSGGEWHRVATARAYLRRSPIILLDEPTSMLDSWAEAEWFERFRNLARGRTAVVITHRFTIAMRADIIHVMDAGQLVESGSHHELLAQNGLYSQSWTTQMQTAAQRENEATTDSSPDYHPLTLEEVGS
jgi:ATP-binding cassette subfamily B protein